MMTVEAGAEHRAAIGIHAAAHFRKWLDRLPSDPVRAPQVVPLGGPNTSAGLENATGYATFVAARLQISKNRCGETTKPNRKCDGKRHPGRIE
jgi:hypothetical protein